MPFTPFHMGPALLFKPVLKQRFSLIVFGTAQILIDIEPGIGMLRGSEILHGSTHTFLGALIIGLLAAAIGRWLAPILLKRWNQELRHYRLSSLQEPLCPSWSVALVSAWLGTGSHLLLDALMHTDMQPFAPWSSDNPLLFMLSVTQIYGLTAVMGVIGVIVWAIGVIIAIRSIMASQSAKP